MHAETGMGARIQQMLINPRAQSASHVLSRGTDSPAAAKWPDGVRFCQRFLFVRHGKRALGCVFSLLCHSQEDWLRKRNRKIRQKSYMQLLVVIGRFFSCFLS
jgi:hypothetical protein